MVIGGLPTPKPRHFLMKGPSRTKPTKNHPKISGHNVVCRQIKKAKLNSGTLK
jgi:hypothetical protein